MRITLEDGTVVERAFSLGACTGYRARAIEMEADDFLGLAALAASDLAEFQAAMRQMSARLPGGRIDRDLADSIRLEMLCAGCPEAYDAFVGDRQVGYLRLRHGCFTVECPDSQGKTVLTAYPDGDGVFEPDERERYLDMARAAIADELSLDAPGEDSVFSIYAGAVGVR